MLSPKIRLTYFWFVHSYWGKIAKKTLARRPQVNLLYDPRFNQLPKINFKSQKLVKPQLLTAFKALS